MNHLDKPFAITTSWENAPEIKVRQKTLRLSPDFIVNLCTYLSTETHHLLGECIQGVPTTARIICVEHEQQGIGFEFGILKITLEDGSFPEVGFSDIPELMVRFERNWKTELAAKNAH